MGVLREILFLAILSWIGTIVIGSETLDTNDSNTKNTTQESAQEQLNLTRIATEDMKKLAAFLERAQVIIDDLLSINERRNLQAKKLVHNITQTMDYDIFIRQNLKNKFLEPQEMTEMQNATLSFLYSLNIGQQNDSGLIDEVYMLTELETKRMFRFLTSWFNLFQDSFKNIYNNYMLYKRNGVLNNYNKNSLRNQYKISILVESMHVFNITEVRSTCTLKDSASTLTKDSPITLYTLFNNGSHLFNDNGELSESINLINSSDISYDQSLYLEDNIQHNLDRLKVILNIIGEAKNGENALHWASRKGILGIVREILSNGNIDVDSKNNARWTALQIASKEGHLSIVKVLLDHHASVNNQDRNRDSPLHWASWEGHVSVVDTLLKRNANINIQNNYGNTPLSWAAWGGKLEVVRLLLRNNAKIDLKNYDEGWTSLHRAAEQGQLYVVDEFLSRDPSLVYIRDNRQRTAYDVAKQYGYEDVADFIKSLMNKPKITELKTNTKKTSLPPTKGTGDKSDTKALPNRYKTELEKTAEEGNFYAVRYILDHFGVSFFQNENRSSPLHMASKSGTVRVVRELLANRTTIEAKDNNGWAALHFAAKVGSLPIVKLLLEKNATVNVQNKNGDTPLHWAAWGGHLPVVKELVNKNAFINAVNKWGTTALSWASWKGDLDVVKFMLDNNAKVQFRSYDEGWSSMHRAVGEGHKPIAIEFISRDPCVLYLKDHRGNFPYMLAAEKGYYGLSDYLRSRMNKNIYNCKNNTYTPAELSGNSPIHWAALEGNLDATKMILSQHGLYVAFAKRNGDTPLHLASAQGHIEIIEELISSGASVDRKNDKGKTPLHLAASNGKLLAVMKLLENNATVDIKDKNGDSPLHWAAWEGYLAVIEELIERNASVNIVNSFGNTPVSWAAWAGRVDVIELLVKYGADIELKNFDEGFNALHRASEQGQMAAVKTLLALNPSLLSIKDNRSRTPYDVAKQYKHEEVAEYLKSLKEKVN